jgi:hypothetical protein
MIKYGVVYYRVKRTNKWTIFIDLGNGFNEYIVTLPEDYSNKIIEILNSSHIPFIGLEINCGVNDFVKEQELPMKDKPTPTFYEKVIDCLFPSNYKIQSHYLFSIPENNISYVEVFDINNLPRDFPMFNLERFIINFLNVGKQFYYIYSKNLLFRMTNNIYKNPISTFQWRSDTIKLFELKEQYDVHEKKILSPVY